MTINRAKALVGKHNEWRAIRLERLLTEIYDDQDSVIQDCLSDLMHVADRHKQSFIDHVDAASTNYLAEFNADDIAQDAARIWDSEGGKAELQEWKSEFFGACPKCGGHIDTDTNGLCSGCYESGLVAIAAEAVDVIDADELEAYAAKQAAPIFDHEDADAVSL